MEAWLWRQTRPPTMPEVRHEEDHLLRCIDHLLRYSILDVSCVYRNGIEKRYSIEVPTAARTYRACIERVSNKKCLDTVSRGVYRKSRYTYDTLRYTSIHFDTFMGKMHPDTWGKRPYFPQRQGTVANDAFRGPGVMVLGVFPSFQQPDAGVEMRG